MAQRFILLIFTVVIMSGCAVGPTLQKPDKNEVIPPPQGVGIALAGGGTKAASYAMGVLAAVADDAEGFKQIKAISSVSGGGYSAFYLYSKLIVGDKNSEEQLRPVKDYFDDCLPDIYEDVLPRPYKGLPPLCSTKNADQYRFQQFVRCRQDILENDCKQQLGRNDRGEYSAAIKNTAFLLGATGMMIAPSLVANTIFDWPINVSPTRYAYMEGIGTAYGLYPKSAAAIHETSNIINSCNEETFFNCDSKSGAAHLKRENLHFKDLRELTQARANTLPVWYINATASKSRSIYGWSQKGRRDFSKYTLKMSPSNATSGFYGEVPEYENELDLLDGVTSAAAFFDANETSFKQPWRMSVALGLHIVTLDWGKDIPNPAVNTSWRILHSILPAPLYYIDSGLRRILAGAGSYQHSSYIRLLDGGNNDDLGAYTLIEAGMKHIIISDHSYDGVQVKKGAKVTDTLATMKDVCILQNEIALRGMGGKPSKLVIPGLKDLARHCLPAVDESECCDKPFIADVKESNHSCKSCETVPGVEGTEFPTRGGYSILGWKHNVLLGCITSQDNKLNTCRDNDVRVYVIKPALDLKDFMGKYLEPTPTGKYSVKENSCSDSKIPGVCEVAAYLADWYNHADKDAVLHPFPQNSTVAITFASTGKVYGAYRELARWHMHDALAAQALPIDEFNNRMEEQGKDGNQIERIEIKK